MPAQLVADIERLRQDGFTVEVIPDGTRFLLVLRGFKLPDEYVPAVVDLMLMADYLYPASAMDMFWTSPTVSKQGGGCPQSAEQTETHGGRSWQRWSWHYGGWNPATHSIVSHLEVVRDRLARGC